MPLKLNIGLCRKIGQPDFGSVGATCNVELEIDQGLLEHDLESFHAKVNGAYVACSQAINDELARQQGPSASPAPATSSNGNGNGHGSQQAYNGGNGSGDGSNGRGRHVTDKQLAYVRQLAGQIDALGTRRLDPLANRLYGKTATELSSFEGSQLIDALKEIKAGRTALPADLDGATS